MDRNRKKGRGGVKEERNKQLEDGMNEERRALREVTSVELWVEEKGWKK